MNIQHCKSCHKDHDGFSKTCEPCKEKRRLRKSKPFLQLEREPEVATDSVDTEQVVKEEPEEVKEEPPSTHNGLLYGAGLLIISIGISIMTNKPIQQERYLY